MITSTSPDPWPADDDLEITPDLIQRFTADLDACGIAVDIFSGAWGPRFVELVPVKPWLVLASETIYSPASLPAFTQTMVGVVDRHGNHAPRALVAAKMVYFGVGGGVHEFLRLLRDGYSNVGKERYVFDTFEIAEKSGGVARVVLELPLR
jgi:protein-histidine N-methyltransferase